MNHIKSVAEPLCSEINQIKVDRLLEAVRKTYNGFNLFLSKKLDFSIKEQEKDYRQKEEEIEILQGKNEAQKNEIRRLHDLFDLITERSGALAKEVRREILSRAYILEEKKYLDELQVLHDDKKNPKTLLTCFNDLGIIANFLANIAQEKSGKTSGNCWTQNRAPTMRTPIIDKMQLLVAHVTAFIETVSVQSDVSGETIRYVHFRLTFTVALNIVLYCGKPNSICFAINCLKV